MAPDPRAIIFGSSAAVRKNGARTSTRSASCGRLATTSIALGPQDRAALDALVAKGRSTLITGQMLRTLTGGLARRAALARA
jgi:hypothetical protein